MKKFEISDADGEPIVLLGDEECEIADIDDTGGISVEGDLEMLRDVSAAGIPDKLTINVHSEDGFGTYFFHELSIQREASGLRLHFICHTPNKFWEGRHGLAAFIEAVAKQVTYYESLTVTQTELVDDWKGITVACALGDSDAVLAGVSSVSQLLTGVLKDAEVALSGLSWRLEFETDEDLFCRELLYPLLKRIGFLHVRYTHGKKEYGKDFTFSEMTPFGIMRHYGLQAKAGDVSGQVNSAVDELLGQIADAFDMPYYSVGSADPRYISTFVIAISGAFTENAREKIVQKMPKGRIGSVIFLDREALDELVERFWRK